MLRTGRGSTSYALTAVDSSGNLAVLGQRDGQYRIVRGSADGTYLETWKLTAEEIPQQSVPAALYIASGGAAYVGLYDTAQPQTRLLLYRITDSGRSAELLLSEPCEGDCLAEQMTQTRLSTFSEVDSVVTFALMQGDDAQFYRRTGLSSGLETGERISVPGLQAAVALADGTILAAGENMLYPAGQTARELPDGMILNKLIRAGTGIYCIDGAGLEVFYADCADWQMFSALRLDTLADTLDKTLDISITRDGAAVLLTDDGGLLLDRDGAVTDLSSMLVPPVWRCVLILAAFAAAVLIVTTLVWFVLCVQRRLRLPLLLRWGAAVVIFAALAVGIVHYRWVLPAAENAAQQRTVELADSVTALAAADGAKTDESLVNRLDGVLAAAFDGGAAVCVYEQSGEQWYLAASNTALSAGTRGEMCRYFDAQLAATAAAEKASVGASQQCGQLIYTRYIKMADGRLLGVSTDGGALLAQCLAENLRTERGVVAAAALLTAAVLVCLCIVTSEIRRVNSAMQRLAAGERGVRVHLGSGDELAGLAESLTALSHTVDEQARQQEMLARSYRRFVPERILSLLGKASVADVDKQTVVSREMTAMTLRFQFPPQVYAASGRELFDNINEILERTAPIVTRSGGAVFNFAYNGFDAVFEKGGCAAVSAAVAVQQRILELNRSREAVGAPPVTMRIAIDEGDVMFGVVGDRDQMEPTSVSSSFSTLGHLIELCARLQAGILCTQAVMDGAAGYAGRYMGKCREGDALLRVYEIFDGDPYDVRKCKEQTGGQFSQGVYALYSQDFPTAKRIFLNLVHQNGNDGGARCYLYLADRLEKQPEQEISLDA